MAHSLRFQGQGGRIKRKASCTKTTVCGPRKEGKEKALLRAAIWRETTSEIGRQSNEGPLR